MSHGYQEAAVRSLGIEQVVEGIVRSALVTALQDPTVKKALRCVVRDELVEIEKRAGSVFATDEATLTVQQAAKFANVSEGTIRDWISKKKLTSLKAGNRHRILKEELVRYMADKETREVISVEAEAAKIVALDQRKLRAKGGC